MKKLLSITLAAALTLGSLSTVAFGAETEAEILPGNGQKIGVSMPTKDLQRWNQDGDNMKKLSWKQQAMKSTFSMLPTMFRLSCPRLRT